MEESVWVGKSGLSTIEGGLEVGGEDRRRTAGEGGGDSNGGGFVAAAIDIL